MVILRIPDGSLRLAECLLKRKTLTGQLPCVYPILLPKLPLCGGNNTYQDRVGFPSPGTNGSAGRIEAGTKIGSYYIWKYAGITDNGRWLLYDKNDNVILSDKKTYDDKRYIGNAIPALMVSWDHTSLTRTSL